MHASLQRQAPPQNSSLKCPLAPNSPASTPDSQNKRQWFQPSTPPKEHTATATANTPMTAPSAPTLPPKPTSVLPVCAVCLSRESHKGKVTNCTATHTWDKQFETFCTRFNSSLITRTDHQSVCAKWQRDEGCKEKHAHLHVCSGCGATSHGACNCPRAQKAPPTNTIHS